MNTKHWVWPSDVIVAAVIFAVIMFLASVSFSSCEKGKAESVPTTVAKKVASTTTKPVQVIPQEDRTTLNKAYEKYKVAVKLVKKCDREIPALEKKPVTKLDALEKYAYKDASDMLAGAKADMRDAACDYNLVAEKYTNEQLDKIWLVKRLEVPE